MQWECKETILVIYKSWMLFYWHIDYFDNYLWSNYHFMGTVLCAEDTKKLKNVTLNWWHVDGGKTDNKYFKNVKKLNVPERKENSKWISVIKNCSLTWKGETWIEARIIIHRKGKVNKITCRRVMAAMRRKPTWPVFVGR